MDWLSDLFGPEWDWNDEGGRDRTGDWVRVSAKYRWCPGVDQRPPVNESEKAGSGRG